MPFTHADLLAIKAELTNDPKTLGLTTNAADDEANANKLNAATLPVLSSSMTSAQLFNCIDPIAYQSLSSQQSGWLGQVLALGQINPAANGNLVSGIRTIFTSGDTRVAFEEAIATEGSRIEQLFQAGTISTDAEITPSDVAAARVAT